MPILSMNDPALARFPWLANAVDFVTEMGIATTDSVKKMHDSMARKTFTASGVDSIKILYDLKAATAESVKLGESEAQGAKRLREVADLHAGQAEAIVRTTTKRAYVDQWAKTIEKPAVKKAFGYVKFVATRDGRTRPSHRALDGFICSVDDPAYQTLLDLLNEWNCRCLLIQLTEKQALKQGIKTYSELPSIATLSLQGA